MLHKILLKMMFNWNYSGAKVKVWEGNCPPSPGYVPGLLIWRMMEMREAYLVRSLVVTFGLKWHKPNLKFQKWP